MPSRSRSLFAATLLSLFLALCHAPDASASLVGALDDITNQIEGSGSSSSSAPAAPSAPVTPQPSPAPPAPSGPEFGPEETDSAPVGAEFQSAAANPADQGNTVVDPKTGISTTTTTTPDGSKKVVKKDKDGRVLSEEYFPPGSDKPDVVKETDPETGITTTTVHNKDGSKDVIETNADGFMTGETHIDAPRPSASMYDPETGTTTRSVRNADGSRTITKTDKDGNVTATETIPPAGKGGMSATMTDPKTGRTTTSTRNADGSRTVVTKDKDGKTVSQETTPPPGRGEPYASSRDPQTGVETTVRGTGDSRTVSESRSWKGEDGSEHTLVQDDRGNQTEIVRGRDGTTTTTVIDEHERKRETTTYPDGSTKTVTDTTDGYVVEKTTKPDGSVEKVKKDHSGNVLRSSTTDPAGRTVETDDLGVKSESRATADGGRITRRTDKDGNVRTTKYDANGDVVNEAEDRQTEKAPGQDYFEQELGGKFGEWDKLPKSAQTQYANSEAQIKERAEMELLRERQNQEKIQSDEEQRRYSEELQRQTDEKLAAIDRDYQEQQARMQERAAKEEKFRQRREAEDKMKDYDRKIYEAQARGDRKEAERLHIEADKYHDEVLVPLAEISPEEQAAIDRKAEVRSRIAQRVTSRARNVADNELVATEGLQDLKEGVTDKAKWLSVGAEMQEETKKTTRMADRELAFATAKQAEIARLLADPQTTKEEKEVLYDMLEMADLSASGASELLQSNAMLTAAGYGIDVAMTVTGGKLVTAAKKGVTAAATHVLAKETAETVVRKTTETGLLKLTGEGATKAAAYTATKVGGDDAARAVERALTYDVGEAAARTAESAATRAIGERGVEAVSNAASKVAAVATTNVSDIPSALRGSGGAGLADNVAPHSPSPAAVADNAAPHSSSPSASPSTRAADAATPTPSSTATRAAEAASPTPTSTASRTADTASPKPSSTTAKPSSTTRTADAAPQPSTATRPSNTTTKPQPSTATRAADATPAPSTATRPSNAAPKPQPASPVRLQPSTHPQPSTATRSAADSAAPKPSSATRSTADNAAPKPSTPARPAVDNAAPRPQAQPAPSAPRTHGDRTMPLDELEGFAKNPPVRTRQPSGVVDDFPTPPPASTRRPNFVEARSKWKKVPASEREALDQGVRDAIDEAAAMGDKWAKRVQADLNSGKLKYQYEPGLKYDGLAPRGDSMLLNPLQVGDNMALQSPDKLASTLVHEYAHKFKGSQKWAASEGRTATGSATKGDYNEVRAFMAESSFNKNLRNARELNGKAFDDSTLKELDGLMGVDGLPPSSTGMKRGLEARKNLQESLVDDVYGPDYAGNPDLAAERLSSFKGGSMTDIRQRLRNARGPNGEITPEYEKIMAEITEQGGRTLPAAKPSSASASAAAPDTVPAPKIDPKRAAEEAKNINRAGADQQTRGARTRLDAADNMVPREQARLAEAERLKGLSPENLKSESLKGVPADKQKKVWDDFVKEVPSEKAREGLMKTPGFDQVMGEIAVGGSKGKGAEYVLKKTSQIVDSKGDDAIRCFEDWQPGMPKPNEAVGAHGAGGRTVKQGPDAVLKNGDVWQGKSYDSFRSAMSDITGFRKSGKAIADKGQIITDLTRYADRGWIDGTGRPISGKFEYHIDASKMKAPTPAQVTEMEQIAKKLRDEAYETFKDSMPKEGFNLEIKIVVD